MADVRGRYEAYREMHDAAWLRLRAGRVGLREGQEALAEIDERFGDLTSGDLTDELIADHDATDFEATRDSLRRLRAGVETAMLECALRPLDLELAQRERSTRVRVGSEEKTAAEWSERLAETPEAETRHEIEQGLDDARAQLRGLREERFVHAAERLAALGHTSGLERARLRQPETDFEAWTRAAELLLQATEPAYRDALAAGLALLRLPSARRSDLQRLERRAGYDRWFAASSLRACLDFTTERMGLRIGDVQGLKVEGALRSGAFCLAPRTPGQVVLVHAQRGGADAYEACFAAAGRALALAFCSAELPVERRRIGDPALADAWGMLLGERLLDPAWIELGPASARAEPFARHAWLLRLTRVRRDAALALVELEHARLGAGGDPRPLADLYAERLSDALGVSHRPALCLADASPELPALSRLRAACLCAQLCEHLRREFGLRFWESRHAGELLKELWHTGTSYGAQALAEQLGLGALSVDFLIETSLTRTAASA